MLTEQQLREKIAAGDQLIQNLLQRYETLTKQQGTIAQQLKNTELELVSAQAAIVTLRAIHGEIPRGDGVPPSVQQVLLTVPPTPATKPTLAFSREEAAPSEPPIN